MHQRLQVRCAISALLVSWSAGCFIPGWVAINVPPVANPTGDIVDEAQRARLERIAGIDDHLWLDVDRIDGSGSVGGFISSRDEHSGGLVLLINGASTGSWEGEPDAVLRFQRGFGQRFRDVGFMTWAVATPECRVPYGSQDLADLLEVIDWLDAGGREFLGVERVYLAGFSTGGTLANQVMLRRELTAIVSMGGLAMPDQLWWFRSLYNLASVLFAGSTGFCQLGATLRDYGPDGAPGWEVLDIVGHLDELKTPVFFVHGTADVVYVVENTLMLRERYFTLIDAGADLPPCEFHIIPDGDHWTGVENPVVGDEMAQYLLSFEPAANE